MSYVPILFPTVVYGPMGDAILVTSAVALAALPVTYTAAPVSVVASVVVTTSVKNVPPATVVVKAVTVPKKDKGSD